LASIIVHLVGGIYGEVGAVPSARVGELATDLLAHRGPGVRGTCVADGIFLGSCGAQPFWNEDETRCIVLDGAIFNSAELRRELEGEGSTFRGRSDAEVVLRAYEEWNALCLGRFNGMFAFAVWDAPSRTLFLARDRIGEKPLSYFRDSARLVFASEIKAILADDTIPRRVDPLALANFLTFGHSGAAVTMFAGIRKLLPGHYLTAQNGRVQIECWWDVAVTEAAFADASEEELADEVLQILDDSVRLRTPAGRPVGVFLSSGVDSSAVTALVRRHASGAMKTFSLGYVNGGTYDELAGARRNAAELGAEHHELRVDHSEVLRHLRTLVYHYDEPLASASGFNLYVLGGMAREHVDVVMTGDGGDELFGGYRRHVADQFATLYQRLPRPLTEQVVPAVISRLPLLGRTKEIAAALPIADPALRHPAWLTALAPELRAELLRPGLRSAGDGHDPTQVYARLHALWNGKGDRLNRQLYAELKEWLPDMLLERTDKALMARGLEARMPLLDHRIVELAFRIPERHKVRGLKTQRVLKRAVAGLAPERAMRKRKQGFATPVDPWLRGPVGPYAREILLDERTRRRPYFDPRVVERLWNEHASGRHIRGRALWALLNFELWHRIYLDREGV
jgi:asparagine synthase (glutamine-hydrolysing)